MENAGIDLFEAMSTLRAVRRLRTDPVPDDVLRKVLTAATWAPNGGNRQPWRVIAIRKADNKQQPRDLYLPIWTTYGKAHKPAIAQPARPQRSRMEKNYGPGRPPREDPPEA